MTKHEVGHSYIDSPCVTHDGTMNDANRRLRIFGVLAILKFRRRRVNPGKNDVGKKAVSGRTSASALGVMCATRAYQTYYIFF